MEEAVVGGGKVQGLLEEGEEDLALDGGWRDGGEPSGGNRSGRAENSFPISALLGDHPCMTSTLREGEVALSLNMYIEREVA